ncbi:hypothetical protein GTQ40_17280 [Flavobacteriaceae bacterium R38]|nr:hypothetical protein [Flavobacteriaceae bacterium R38]
MRPSFLVFGVLYLAILNSCIKKHEHHLDVDFDTSFPGARLDSVIYNEEDNIYTAYINPAFEPVNESPWFAFGISSETKKEIRLELEYGKYKHRYIPKLSSDKKNWKTINASNIEIDTISGNALIRLEVSQDQLYVSAQELESSEATYQWLDTLINQKAFLSKEVAGRTVKNNEGYVLTSNNDLKKAVVLIARQHPPEIPGGTIGFKAFYETLLNDSQVAQRFREKYNIITFPLLNPDGADAGNWRHNANGADLNRDWQEFRQPETQMVKSYLNDKTSEGTEIEFAIDFHTSYSGPYLLVLDSINEQKTQKIIPNWIKDIETGSSFKVEARRRSQELPYCYNYFFNEYQSEAVTYEEGDEIDREIIKQRAITYANSLMKTLIK